MLKTEKGFHPFWGRSYSRIIDEAARREAKQSFQTEQNTEWNHWQVDKLSVVKFVYRNK